MSSHVFQRRIIGAPLVLLLVAAVAVAALSACGGDDGRDPVTVSIVIPAGTQRALEAGQRVEIMPTRLEFNVGDTLYIRNDDDTDQSVGPYFVPAGAEFSFTYNSPGVYEGYCPLSEGERYEIVVEA